MLEHPHLAYPSARPFPFDLADDPLLDPLDCRATGFLLLNPASTMTSVSALSTIPSGYANTACVVLTGSVIKSLAPPSTFATIPGLFEFPAAAAASVSVSLILPSRSCNLASVCIVCAVARFS